jgi:hypothetical protein
MKKPKLLLPPVPVPDTAAMQAMINKGGSVAATEAQAAVASSPGDDPLKSFTIRLYASMLAELQRLKEAQPKKKPKSIHSFVIEAIAEKIERERRKAARATTVKTHKS